MHPEVGSRRAGAQADASVTDQSNNLELKWFARGRLELPKGVPRPAMFAFSDVLAVVPVDRSDRGLLATTVIQALERHDGRPLEEVLFDAKILLFLT